MLDGIDLLILDLRLQDMPFRQIAQLVSMPLSSTHDRYDRALTVLDQSGLLQGYEEYSRR